MPIIFSIQFFVMSLPLVSRNNDYAEISAFMSVGDWGGTALDEQHISTLFLCKTNDY